VPAVQLKQWSILAVVGIIVVILLSQLSSIDHGLQQRRQAVTVFQPNPMKLLTDDILVDTLSKLPIHDRIVKVGWDHSILSVDLLGLIPDNVWADIGQLIVYAYSDVHNVKQVLIRVFADKGDTRLLLLAAEPRKGEWTESELSELKQSILRPESELNSLSRISITPAGKRWIANFANS